MAIRLPLPLLPKDVAADSHLRFACGQDLQDSSVAKSVVEMCRSASDKEAEALKEDLRRAGWNVSAAARLLGIDRTTLHRRMRRLGVSLPPRRT